MKRIIFAVALLGIIACQKENHELKLESIQVKSIKTGSEQELTDISFCDSKNGYICGAMGTLLKTKDGGENWVTVKTEIKPSLNCIQMLDEKHVLTARNELYRTSDGGSTWETSGLENLGSSIFDIYFPNTSTGFILKNGVMKSSDGGKTWQTKFDSGINLDKGGEMQYYALVYNLLQFASDKVGYLAGGKTHDGASSGNMIKTEDGGETWKSLNLNTSQVTALQFVNETTGFFFNFMKQLYKTTDGGKNWTLVSDKVPDSYPDCHIIDENKMILCTQQGIYHSLDGGINWEKDYSTSDDNALFRMKFINERTGFAVGRNGNLVKIEID